MMFADPIDLHDADLDRQAEDDDAHWSALPPAAAQIRAAHNWPTGVYVSEEAEALRLQVERLKRRLGLC